MRPLVLIAMNFAREQRWPLFFLLLWVLGFAVFGLFVDSPAGAEDALMIFKQLAVYAVAFAVFFGSSAIQSDLRSRRILAMLSKGIARWQYLAGLLLGMALLFAAVCVCMGFTASWLLGRFGFALAALWSEMLALFAACMLIAALTLCLSAFLPPLFAAIGSGLLAGLPALLTLQGREFWKYVVPLYALLEPLVQAEFRAASQASPGIVCLGWVEAAVFALLGCWIFSRRDVVFALE